MANAKERNNDLSSNLKAKINLYERLIINVDITNKTLLGSKRWYDISNTLSI